MHIAVVGLSHNTAPVEIREKLSIAEQTMEDSLQRLRADDQVLEASILSTCNRLEIYTLLRHPELGISAVGSFLSQVSGLEVADLTPHLFVYHHEEAIGHLLRVAAGLDSLVLGEGQILSQVKKMVRLGQEYRSQCERRLRGGGCPRRWTCPRCRGAPGCSWHLRSRLQLWLSADIFEHAFAGSCVRRVTCTASSLVGFKQSTCTSRECTFTTCSAEMDNIPVFPVPV